LLGVFPFDAAPRARRDPNKDLKNELFVVFGLDATRAARLDRFTVRTAEIRWAVVAAWVGVLFTGAAEFFAIELVRWTAGAGARIAEF
jgi:hypothetical protein